MSKQLQCALVHYSCRLYCWKFWYCHNLGTNLAAVINLLFHSGISSFLRFWSGHIYSIDTIWRNSLRLLSYHDKMLAIQRIIQRFQCTTQKRFGLKDIQVCLPKIYCYVCTRLGNLQLYKWYFVTKIVLTYCEIKMFQ